jgi:hypothetical protein
MGNKAYRRGRGSAEAGHPPSTPDVTRSATRSSAARQAQAVPCRRDPVRQMRVHVRGHRRPHRFRRSRVVCRDYLVAECVTSRVLTEGVTVSGSQRLPARPRALSGRRMAPWTQGWGDNGASPPGWSARLGEPAVDDAQRDTLAVRSRVLVERRRRGLRQRILYTGLRSGTTGETPA